jgi:hypothetical protein
VRRSGLDHATSIARPQCRVVTGILRLGRETIHGLGGDDTTAGGGDDVLRGKNGQVRPDSRDSVRGNDVLQDGDGRGSCQADRVDDKKNR